MWIYKLNTAIVCDYDESILSFIKDKIKNYIFYTGYSPSCNVDSVWFNFNNGGYNQCEYLINNGHVVIITGNNGSKRLLR